MVEYKSEPLKAETPGTGADKKTLVGFTGDVEGLVYETVTFVRSRTECDASAVAVLESATRAITAGTMVKIMDIVMGIAPEQK